MAIFNETTGLIELQKGDLDPNYLDENIDKLEEWFLENDGWACTKDNFEDCFNAWLDGSDYEFLQSIINTN